jgi:hypothetical protein
MVRFTQRQLRACAWFLYPPRLSRGISAAGAGVGAARDFCARSGRNGGKYETRRDAGHMLFSCGSGYRAGTGQFDVPGLQRAGVVYRRVVPWRPSSHGSATVPSLSSPGSATSGAGRSAQGVPERPESPGSATYDHGVLPWPRVSHGSAATDDDLDLPDDRSAFHRLGPGSARWRRLNPSGRRARRAAPVLPPDEVARPR